MGGEVGPVVACNAQPSILSPIPCCQAQIIQFLMPRHGPKKEQTHTHTHTVIQRTHTAIHTPATPQLEQREKRKLQNSSNNGEKAKFGKTWLTLLRLLANQLIILAKQTAHTHTQRETTNFRCVYVCIMHLSAPSICGASTSSCCSIDNPVGGRGGMATGAWQSIEIKTGTHKPHTQVTHTHPLALLSLTTSPAAPAG